MKTSPAGPKCAGRAPMPSSRGAKRRGDPGAATAARRPLDRFASLAMNAFFGARLGRCKVTDLGAQNHEIARAKPFVRRLPAEPGRSGRAGKRFASPP